MQTDILIVGTGFAGLTAAIEAKQLGAVVRIIEKMKGFGGNSIISDGGIAAPCTDLQTKYGIEDSPDRMYEDMLTAGLGLNDPDLLRTVVDQAKSAFDWTIDVLGVPYLDRVDIFGGHSVPRCYTPENVSGATIIKRMIQKLKDLDVPIHYQTAFDGFIQDDSGSVVAAKILRDYDFKTGLGKEDRINVTKGIILATGGFGADIAFRTQQDERLDGSIMTTNKISATAEAMTAAIHIGSDTRDLREIQLGAWASPDEKGFGNGPLFADYVLFQYGIIIDPTTGKRFVNELGDRKVSADAILSVGHPCIGIADAAAVEQAGWDLSKALNKGVVKTFDTLIDISEYYTIPIDALKETVDRYNDHVVQGQDRDFGKQIVQSAKPIVRAPYYVMRLWPKVHFTMGGLRINTRAQVVNKDGQPFPNLYAAGEVTGGVHGASRLGSCAITECIVFGRIAGKEASK